jgi:hypothetical protein
MESPSDAVKRQLVEYVKKNGEDLGFTKFFWRECEPLPRDIELFTIFAKAVRDRAKGVLTTDALRQLGVGLGTISSYSKLNVMPKLAHYLKAFLELGQPVSGHVWLTTDCTHGQALPVGQFIQVPLALKEWKSAEMVIHQLREIGEAKPVESKEYVFGFFLGIMIGDAAKKKQGRGHRHVALVLSKRYDTNLRIGQYACVCGQALGLRMHRVKDIERRRDKPFGFYQWTSQSSPLVDWLFHVALGLKEGELTTYHPIRADWAIEAPLEFRRGLIQGISESDGSVSVASQEVEFWIGPNWNWMIKLLGTFDLKGFANREAVTLSKSQAIASFRVPVFSEILRTVRYQRLELMAMSRRLERKERLPVEIRNRVMDLRREGLSVPKIVESIARSYGLLISFEAAQRWARKADGEAAHVRC